MVAAFFSPFFITMLQLNTSVSGLNILYRFYVYVFSFGCPYTSTPVLEVKAKVPPLSVHRKYLVAVKFVLSLTTFHLYNDTIGVILK